MNDNGEGTTQPPASSSSHSAPTHGMYDNLDHVGERVGRAIGSLLGGAKRLVSAPRADAAKQSASSAIGRAEEIVGSTGTRLSHLADAARGQVRRGVARAREEAEDIWAEAGAMRQTRGGKSSRPPLADSPPAETQAEDPPQ